MSDSDIRSEGRKVCVKDIMPTYKDSYGIEIVYTKLKDGRTTGGCPYCLNAFFVNEGLSEISCLCGASFDVEVIGDRLRIK